MRPYFPHAFAICLFVIAHSLCGAQTDSMGLRLEEMDKSFLLPARTDNNNQQVVSASRTLRNISDLPFTIYVVSQEEIVRNGYVTLADVLKDIPAIRVSQPGSGQDGDTFLMRGLFGNAYAKVLVNDLPVKPSAVNAMPLGAQLPIRQAERIEIIFGPAAAVYGADASAGVINIITKQTDRPVFTRADLGLGSNGYNDVSVFFGGKIGKDKRILRFSFFGSNTQFDFRRIMEDADNYSTDNYSDDLDFIRNGNFSNTQFTRELPHLSRSLGFNLQYRSFSIGFENYYRRDHSAIGLNTVAVDYGNPLNYIGENINGGYINFKKDYKKWGFILQIKTLNYQLDERSSSTYVENNLYRFLERTILDEINDDRVRDSIRGQIFDRYFSGSRFSSALSFDYYGDFIVTINPLKNLEIVTGLNIQFIEGRPLNSYRQRNPNTGRIELPIPDISFGAVNGGIFLQSTYTSRRLTAVGGLRFDIPYSFAPRWSPRLALLYKLSNKFSLRGTFATAYRIPNPFFSANTFFVTPGQWNSVRNRANYYENSLNPEETYSYEFGIRLNPSDHIDIDLVGYLSETSNFISYSSDPIRTGSVQGGNELFLQGYRNDNNSNAQIYGIQTRMRIKNIWPRYKLNMDVNGSIADGREVLSFSRTQINQIRQMPTVFGQVNFNFVTGKRLSFQLKNNFATDFARRFIKRDDPQTKPVPGYYTLDLLARLQISRNFQASFNIQNLFNAYYGGLGATGTPDDLLYNPQEIGLSRFRLTYLLD